MYDETGGGIEAGPLNWGGGGPAHPKVGGGEPLWGEGQTILGPPPPQCVFGIIAWSMKSNSLFKGSSLYGEGGGFPNNRKSREG